MKRRHFLQLAASAIAVLPISKLMAAGEACTKSTPDAKYRVLDPAGKTAQRLKYVEDATKSTHKKYKAGSACGNCKYYKVKKGKEAEGWAKCSMAGNKYVTTCGWCKSYKEDKKKKKA